MNRLPIQATIDGLKAIAASQELARNFSLAFWANNVVTHPADQPENVSCGFVGCYVGWTAHQRWLEPFGVELRLAGDVFELSDGERAQVAPNMVYPVLGPGSSEAFADLVKEQQDAPAGTLAPALRAIARVFGIGPGTLDRLIYDSHYAEGDEAGPDMVIEKLEKLVELGEGAFLAWDDDVQREAQLQRDREA